MFTVDFGMIQTMGFAVILLICGGAIKKKVRFLQKYCIPEPVIGGFLFAILHLGLRQGGIGSFEFDSTLRVFFMNMFFTTIGFNASLKILKKGGVMVLKFLFIAVILAILQNVVAVLLAPVVGIHPVLALMTGSTPMIGGHGTSGGIASMVEEMSPQFQGATAVAFTAATFGLVAGSLMGGPLASRLIRKYRLKDLNVSDSAESDANNNINEPIEAKNFMKAFFHILVALFFGSYVTEFLNWTFEVLNVGINFPSYLGAMVIGAVIRNILDNTKFSPPMQEVSIVGDVSLNLFLGVALMTLRLWELADLAIPMIILLLAQSLLIFLFASFVSFRFMGKDYDAAVMSAGTCGFGMGATPNAMANMKSVCDKHGYSSLAFFVVPLVGSLFIDFFNVAQIGLFINMFN